MSVQKPMDKRHGMRWGQRLAAASLVTWLCVMGWVSSAQATSVIQLSVEQMVEMSTLVVRGTVVSQRSIWGPNKMGIVTLVTVRVAEEVLGRSAPKEVVVRHFGGKIGDRKIQMMGGPSFTTGNEVLLFLQSSQYLPKNEYLLIGLTQGKYVVKRADTQASNSSSGNQKAKEPVVLRSLQGLKLFPNRKSTANPGATDSHGHSTQVQRLTLKAFTQQLRQHWKTIQVRRQKKILKLPRPAIPKVTLPKTAKPKVLPKLQPVRPKAPAPRESQPEKK